MFLVSRKRTQQKYRVPYVYSVLPPFILYTNSVLYSYTSTLSKAPPNTLPRKGRLHAANAASMHSEHQLTQNVDRNEDAELQLPACAPLPAESIFFRSEADLQAHNCRGNLTIYETRIEWVPFNSGTWKSACDPQSMRATRFVRPRVLCTPACVCATFMCMSCVWQRHHCE